MTQFTCKGVKQINNRISINKTFTFTIRISLRFSSARQFQIGNFQKYWSQNAGQDWNNKCQFNSLWFDKTIYWTYNLSDLSEACYPFYRTYNLSDLSEACYPFYATDAVYIFLPLSYMWAFRREHFSPDFEGPFRPSRQLSKSSACEKIKVQTNLDLHFAINISGNSQFGTAALTKNAERYDHDPIYL
jgi:hypothetical protein